MNNNSCVSNKNIDKIVFISLYSSFHIQISDKINDHYRMKIFILPWNDVKKPKILVSTSC